MRKQRERGCYQALAERRRERAQVSKDLIRYAVGGDEGNRAGG